MIHKNLQLTQKEINKLQRELKEQTDPDVKKAIQNVLAAIKGYNSNCLASNNSTNHYWYR